jgi:hypothetical protein
MRDVAENALCRISQAASAETRSPAVLGALSVFTVRECCNYQIVAPQLMTVRNGM